MQMGSIVLMMHFLPSNHVPMFVVTYLLGSFLLFHRDYSIEPVYLYLYAADKEVLSVMTIFHAADSGK